MFTLEEVEVGQTLVISFIGYTTQEVFIENEQLLEIFMEANTALLDEVVVVAYGSQIK